MDIHMYHDESDTPASARTSNLNEELGMVRKFLLDQLSFTLSFIKKRK